MTTTRKFAPAILAVLTDGLAAAGLGKVGAAERRATFYSTIVAEKVTAAQLVAVHNDRTPDAPKKSNDSTVAAIVKSAQLWHDAGANDDALPTASARYATDRLAAKVTAIRKTKEGKTPEGLAAAVTAIVTAAKDDARTTARAAAKGKGSTKGKTAASATAAAIVSADATPDTLAAVAAEAITRLTSAINEGKGLPTPDTHRAIVAAVTAYTAAMDREMSARAAKRQPAKK